MNFRVSAFWQAAIALAGAWLIFNWAFPPFMPRSVMITYMIITVIGVMLYFSGDEQRWTEFKAPIIATLQDENKWALRWVLLIFIPLLLGYTVYDAIKPSLETPSELRQVHPAPPAVLKAYDKTYDLATLENPVRAEVLEQLKSDPDTAWQTYREAVRAGSLVYFRNCFYCHGDLVGGKGHFAKGLDPLPTNFRDVGTIAQLQESFLFWRIVTGGPGLPRSGMPWKSAMPVWHEMLSEEEVWNVITFLYDIVEQVPRMWDQDISKAVTGMKDKIVSQRTKMSGEDIYQFRCAPCHGENGAGDGPAAEFLYPRPRDFTQGLLKFKSSNADLPPRDEDLFEVIKYGLTDTSMPGWSALLTDKQINDLITVIKQFDTSATWAPEDAEDKDFDDGGRYLKTDFRVITEQEPADGQIPYSAESIARGREVFLEECKKCHGEEGRGNITSGEFMEDDWGYRIWARDLTKPWTWRVTEASTESSKTANGETSRDETIRNIYTRLSVGIPGTPMPAHRAVEVGEEDAIKLEDRWHVANYAYSLRTDTPPPGRRTVIEAVEVANELPSRVDDEAWEKAPASTFRLVPNVVKEKRLFTPLNNAITVRALYNDREIAFLLEVNDRTDSRPGGPVASQLPDKDETMYSDAIAIQFPKEGAYSTAPVEKPLYRHGDAAHPTIIWYWNAGSVEPPVEPRLTLLDASGPDAELIKRVSGHDLVAHGEWQHGRWRVLMKRPRGIRADTTEESLAGEATGAPDLIFRKGQFIPVSFANWDGNNGEVGSKHTLTPWFWLLLPPDTDYTLVYGAPVGTTVVAFLAGLMLVRGQRRKSLAGRRTQD
ncbi:MAG: c-type cytochrome [Gammaproteobacteria bacterium]|jgi:DMSO reductase family type II enzyme heme b subunit|nr:c-type cytochrome [Gammaproteobacteria bacterium]